jgi:hypothetical protein
MPACLAVLLSRRLHGAIALSLNGVSKNLIFEDFSKICRENSTFIKTRGE